MIEPLDEVVDHVRGPAAGTVILENGDYQCHGVIYGGSYLVPSLEQALTELGSPR
jgi:hypothetical protein